MHTETNYPIYIYVEKKGKGKYQYYEGEFCKGRKMTRKEYRILEKCRQLNNANFHPIALIRNPSHNAKNFIKTPNYKSNLAFPSLESLIDEAIAIYTKEEYTSGLILGFDGTPPLPDRVIVIGNGNYKTETEFLKHAQNNNMWA